MKIPNMQIINNRFQSDESSQVVSSILLSINSWQSIDSLVTLALRKSGYHGDWFGISYPDDLDEYDREVLGLSIPEGFIHVTVDCDSEEIRKEELVTQTFYLGILRECLLLMNMDERAALVQKIIKGDECIFLLTEANRAECESRWIQFVPYLERFGWIKQLHVSEMIASPKSGRLFNTKYDGDLDVLYREMSKKDSNHYDESFVLAYKKFTSNNSGKLI